MKPVELSIGFRSGRLVVHGRTSNSSGGHTRWICLCDCGKEFVATGPSLAKQTTKSCGCIKNKHGKCRTGIYKVWEAMIRRCQSPQSSQYHLYGARGITVSESWKDFRNFYADMGEQPPGMSIDRIDNSKGYSKENCRWATAPEQARNRRSNVMVDMHGKRMCITDAAILLGHVTPQQAQQRVRRGVPPEIAILALKDLKAWRDAKVGGNTEMLDVMRNGTKG